ncbi:hypothetical protein FRB90_005954 [Tulasnella sp. 427]|nr:hypothetical protein FRB90_005954 [Tulasnella sp. 427]
MIELSYALRGKPSWWTKIKNPVIRSKWKAEALEHEIQGDKLKVAEVDWVFDELDDYATMRDEATGIQPSCHVRVWESDQLISEELKAKLKSAASVLENVPEEEQDWHPGADNQVLDLAHPSLFCAVYGRTQYWDTATEPRSLKVLQPPDEDLGTWAYSGHFSWIPTDFQLAENGAPAKALGYINNIHPQQHKDLVAVVEALVGRFSLLWDKVLTDIHPGNERGIVIGKVPTRYSWERPEKSKDEVEAKVKKVKDKDDDNDDKDNEDEDEDKEDDDEDDEDDDDEEDEDEEMYSDEEEKILVLPTVDPQGYRESNLHVADRKVKYSIQGKKVQVIVKLANIHLTPEQPEYPGGSWHVEGMANERIVSTGIYYYDCENITESQLAFRMGVNFEGACYEQSDNTGVRMVYGLEYGGPSNQVVGAVKTSADRCVAFPNIYQHQVSSFELIDPTKPGHRKIIALFLVDPEFRVPSTADIPPQQFHWIRQAAHEAFIKDNQGMKVQLPVEVVDMIAERVNNVMTLAEAKGYRQDLMYERTSFEYEVDEPRSVTWGALKLVPKSAKNRVTPKSPTDNFRLAKPPGIDQFYVLETLPNRQALTSNVVDLRMIELSYALRSKPSWWTKIKNPVIRSKWKAEALEHEIQGAKLNEPEVDWVFDELDDYATMRDEATGVQPSCHVRVWESDQLISEELKTKLKSAASVLENVPEEEQDWHPGADNLVLDLVHPSLFCAVYGRTQYWDTETEPRSLKVLEPPDDDLGTWSYSRQFSWIPTDFQLAENGAPATAPSYINNIHPQQHKDLVAVVEALVGRFSLLWDKVLTDIHPGNKRGLVVGRVPTRYWWERPEKSQDEVKAKPKKVKDKDDDNDVKDNEDADKAKDKEDEDDEDDDEDEDEDEEMYSDEEEKILVLPTVNPQGYRESNLHVADRKVKYSIQGKKIQVIVKLANIHLTPEQPEYPGGSWHVEGMANERIVSTGIYYYDCENITESQLAFRMGVNFEGAYYEQSDNTGVSMLYGLDYGGPSNQVVGAVKTSLDRCVAFPNIYQHQVSSFELIDPTKPGHRKIIALFLVDPEFPVPSTADIPPQQVHWIRQAAHEAFIKDNQGMKVPLPVEVVDMIAERVDNAMTLAEAKGYREDLMDERTSFEDEVDERHFCTEFNFCEH